MQQKRILISRTDRVGDVVLSTGIPRAIKKEYPDSFVAVMLRPYTKDIYINNPFVDQIIVFDPDNDDKKYFREKIAEIRLCKFTHAAMLLPNKKINRLLFRSLILKRYGTGYKFYQFITGVRGISRHKYIPLRHEADYCMDLVRAMGIKAEKYDSEIFLDETERMRVSECKNLMFGGKIAVGIHSTSGNSAPNWKPAVYKRLIELLLADGRFAVAVTDNIPPEELKGIPEVKYPNIDQPLRESIINFAALDYLISASTGPMHIAAALRVKTLSMFCPIPACTPKLWGPLGNDSKIVMPSDKYCSTQCPHDPKKCDFALEGGITPEMIFKAIER